VIRESPEHAVIAGSVSLRQCVHREVEFEGRQRQNLGLTYRNRI